MELTSRKYQLTYVVVEDEVDQTWGFVGFDADNEAQFVGTKSACAQWIIENPDGSWKIISLKQYEQSN